jgi:nicotinate-nucleotide--dimethylbenzimidazole phosphoribosyltransferase
MIQYTINSISSLLDQAIQSKIDNKTKPLGSLGKLETVAFQIARIQQTLEPTLSNATIAVFAADHGIAKQGLVNTYPQEVTYQMVMNFLKKGAAINVFAASNHLDLKIIDAGVNFNFGEKEGLINSKIAFGTNNYLCEPAMTLSQCQQALLKGGEIIKDLYDQKCNCIGFGEMGIGNSSSSALIMSVLSHIPLADCVGNGTGVSSDQYQLKLNTLHQVLFNHLNIDKNDPMAVLATFGGFEIAQMCGGMLRAAELGMVILVDGFISTVAMLVAQAINRNVLEYAIFTHQSNEKGHLKLLEYLNQKPLIAVDMRLGEGSGIAVAYPLIVSACSFLNKMASFESAQITNKQ